MQLFDKTYTPIREGDLVEITEREYRDIVFKMTFESSGYICFESIWCNATVRIPAKYDVEVFDNIKLHTRNNKDSDIRSLFE